LTCVALCSAKGSPGVTTLVCLLGAVWPRDRRVVVTECDPGGGDLAARFGLSTKRGMTGHVLSRRQGDLGFSSLDEHLQVLPGGLEVLVGPVGADAARALDDEIGSIVGAVFPSEVDLLVDCGRIVSGAIGQRKLLRESDIILVASAPSPPALVHSKWLIDWVEAVDAGRERLLVLIGDGSYPVEEVSGALGHHVDARVPNDPVAAAIACGGSGSRRSFARSPLVTASRTLAERIGSDLGGQPTEDEVKTVPGANVLGRIGVSAR
jgi:MinD-like ATPase involved in chromosome partitioning or flagellar assembly